MYNSTPQCLSGSIHYLITVRNFPRPLSPSAIISDAVAFFFVPSPVRWSPNMGNHVFATQSATLFLGYYLNQILIYRPFIPSVKPDAATKTTASRVSFPFPALPICLNAARTSIRILEAEKKAGLSNIPIIIRACQEAGGILITHVWRLKTRDRAHVAEGKPRRCSGPLIAELVADVQKVIDILDSVGDRWPLAYSLA